MAKLPLESRLGLVAIGRNEGERLRTCLSSVAGQVAQLVYVDSGSTDGSAAMAQSMGAHVVKLDMNRPFTAARARNEGLQALQRLMPDVEFVQFIDGDCQMVNGWLPAALFFLQQHPQYAMVCGRLRERFPEKSIYNRLCDMEWDSPIGEAKACGGIAMGRVAPILLANGFLENLIAGEEPELCVRLRKQGWKIWRLDHEMALHDAAMTHFSQWWRRSLRAGYAFAEGAWMHGAPPERHWVKETVRALAWGAVLPTTILTAALWVSPWWLAVLAVYPMQIARLVGSGSPFERACFLTLGKFAEALGAIKFYTGRLRGAASSIIEYK